MSDPAQCHDVVKQTTGALSAAADRSKLVCAVAPGRINLIGEHTDYNDGWALPMAINRWLVIAAAPLSSSKSVIRSRAMNVTLEVDLHAEDVSADQRRPAFRDAVRAIWREIAGQSDSHQPYEIIIGGNLPVGAGLASSAALLIAWSMACEKIVGRAPMTAGQRIALCQQIEHEQLGTPCGTMDFIASLHGQTDHALLIDCRDNTFESVALPQRDTAWLVIDTDVQHDLAASEYAERRAGCLAAADEIGADSLREVTRQQVENTSLDASLRDCALHVIDENKRTRQAAAAIRDGNLYAFGQLMFNSHDSLRDLYRVSCPELDVVIETVRAMPRNEAYGARMTGGGFGGCAIALCRTGFQQAVAQRIAQAFEQEFRCQPTIFPVSAVAGAHLLSADWAA